MQDIILTKKKKYATAVTWHMLLYLLNICDGIKSKKTNTFMPLIERIINKIDTHTPPLYKQMAFKSPVGCPEVNTVEDSCGFLISFVLSSLEILDALYSFQNKMFFIHD